MTSVTLHWRPTWSSNLYTREREKLIHLLPWRMQYLRSCIDIEDEYRSMRYSCFLVYCTETLQASIIQVISFGKGCKVVRYFVLHLNIYKRRGNLWQERLAVVFQKLPAIPTLAPTFESDFMFAQISAEVTITSVKKSASGWRRRRLFWPLSDFGKCLETSGTSVALEFMGALNG